jgi:hypothetical protein
VVELLHAQDYFFNPYSLPPLATAAGLVFVMVQFFLQRRHRGIRMPLILAFLAATVWLVAFHFMYASNQENKALIWAKLAYLGVPFISVALYDLAVRMRGQYQSQKVFVWGAWMVSGIFTMLAFDSDLIARVTRQWWGFYPRYGQAGPIFVGYFGVMAAGSLWHFSQAYQEAKSASRQRMVQFVALGVITGYLAGVDFMAKFGPSIYPFGYFCIFISALLVFQGIAQDAGDTDADHTMTGPNVIALQQVHGIRLHRQQRALLLALDAVMPDRRVSESIKLLLEALADGLALERVGLWHYRRADSMLQCRNIYRRASRIHRIVTGQFVGPGSHYLDPLQAGDWLTVENVVTDARMRVFRSVYMDFNGLLSALEVPIRRNGELLAVLSCQAAGTPQWHPDEREFLQLLVELFVPLLEIPGASEPLKERVSRILPTVHAAMEELLRRDRLLRQIEQEGRSGASTARRGATMPGPESTKAP